MTVRIRLNANSGYFTHSERAPGHKRVHEAVLWFRFRYDCRHFFVRDFWTPLLCFVHDG